MPRGLLAAVGAVVALVAPSVAEAGPGLLVGAVEDDVRSTSAVEAQTKMTLMRLSGFRAVRVTSFWTPGRSAPTDDEVRVLGNVTGAAATNNLRVFVTVMHPGSRTTPLTEEAQNDFAAYAAAIVRSVPAVRDVIVANEPNLNRFWLPQFGPEGENVAATAYLSLLAKTYDALKAASRNVDVHGVAISPRGSDNPQGSRHTHSPTKFIRDLGLAYRASGRSRPIMDTFVVHPYGEHSSLPPTFAHPLNTSIGIADYDKLVALLGEAFDGTAQRGSSLPVVYGEYGVETQIPASKAALYTGQEPATTRPTTEETQAAYYEQALGLSFCQPNVAAFLVFHSIDERTLATWQSGLYYVDGTAKSSLPRVSEALDRTAGGSIARCPGLALGVQPTLLRFGTRSAAKRGAFKVRLRCSLDCAYQVRLENALTGRAVLGRRGRAEIGETVRVDLGSRRLRAGQPYRYTLHLTHPVNPGPPTVRRGPVFRLP